MPENVENMERSFVVFGPHHNFITDVAFNDRLIEIGRCYGM
jgi:hypothetical protein